MTPPPASPSLFVSSFYLRQQDFFASAPWECKQDKRKLRHTENRENTARNECCCKYNNIRVFLIVADYTPMYLPSVASYTFISRTIRGNLVRRNLPWTGNVNHNNLLSQSSACWGYCGHDSFAIERKLDLN
jgi:hypothetical protein